MKIDIIIPVYKPTGKLLTLIEKLENQTVPFHQIILMNTEEKYLEQLIYGTHFYEKHKRIRITHLSKREFNHGRTRHLAVKQSTADVFVMMTQDATPVDEFLLERMSENLKDDVAVCYARQIPDEKSSEAEKFGRHMNYPAQSMRKTKQDLTKLGIKTFFCSNVCCAYRRDVYEELGGFTRHTIFNEDMIYAAAALEAGYAIVYEANAQVIHSHDYTAKQQFKRNFDLGVSQAKNPQIFEQVSSTGEGKKLVKATAKYLKEKKLHKQRIAFYYQSAFRYMGYFFGKHYHRLPKRIILSFTMNKEYWYQDQRVRDSASIDPSQGYGRSEQERQTTKK
ncbi:MAG: glycosyltransferase [Clostridium sp.]|jgi:rhamnosyltransferase|nr:glycosyltransferase [Clostridium sp.]